MGKLDNKVAIVTGAGSGMGKEIAKLFAKEGAKVVASDINLETVQKVVDEIVAAGGTTMAVKTDVAIENDIQSLVDTTIKEYGTVDIVINNAGIMDNFLTAESVTDETWNKVMNVNVTGPMRLIRKVMPIFKQKGKGNIVNISSIGGLMGSRAGVAYTASKHALIGMSKNIGFQYAKLGIRCNAIAPGAVNTNIGSTITAPDKFGMDTAMLGMNLNPRVGEANEIANVALFLASDESSLVNAAVITVDSGWTAY